MNSKVMERETFRSGLEYTIALQIEQAGFPVEYETETVCYKRPETNHKYTPDFKLGNGILIEAKGRLFLKDRQKHLLVRECNPALDIRFIFQNPNQRISKKSKTTYAMWADKKGFKWAKKFIPQEWFDEARIVKQIKEPGINLNWGIDEKMV